MIRELYRCLRYGPGLYRASRRVGFSRLASVLLSTFPRTFDDTTARMASRPTKPTPPPSTRPAPQEWTGRNSIDFRMHPGGFVRLTVTNYDANARCIMDIDQATAKRFGKSLFRACLDREHNESDHP